MCIRRAFWYCSQFWCIVVIKWKLNGVLKQQWLTLKGVHSGSSLRSMTSFIQSVKLYKISWVRTRKGKNKSPTSAPHLPASRCLSFSLSFFLSAGQMKRGAAMPNQSWCVPAFPSPSHWSIPSRVWKKPWKRWEVWLIVHWFKSALLSCPLKSEHIYNLTAVILHTKCRSRRQKEIKDVANEKNGEREVASLIQNSRLKRGFTWVMKTYKYVHVAASVLKFDSSVWLCVQW